MPRLFLLFSHTLTAAQTADADASLGVGGDALRPLPEELQRRFSNVPPELEFLTDWLQPLHDWLRQHARPGDYALVQGDFGVVVDLVDFCRTLGLSPLYSTTERRVVVETATGLKTSIFNHVRYRFY